MAQQTQPRDSNGRFLKTKPSYKDLERIIDEQKKLIEHQQKSIASYSLALDSLYGFLHENLPFWKKKALNHFKKNLAMHIVK